MKIKLVVWFLVIVVGAFFYGCGAEEPAKGPRQVERPAPAEKGSTPEPSSLSADNLKKAEQIQGLIETLEGDDERAAIDAALQLGLLGDESAVEPLIDMAERESGSLRVAALKALGNIGDGRALELLLAAMGDSSVEFRRVAAGSLGNFRDPSAIAPLIEALQDEDSWVRIDARYSLEKLTGQDFENYNAWSEWNSQR